MCLNSNNIENWVSNSELIKWRESKSKSWDGFENQDEAGAKLKLTGARCYLIIMVKKGEFES